MKVWVVLRESEHKRYQIDSIHSSKEKAIAAAKALVIKELKDSYAPKDEQCVSHYVVSSEIEEWIDGYNDLYVRIIEIVVQ